MTLLERHRDAEIFDLANGKRRFVTGGDIYNPLPFDGGPRARGTFIFADGVKQGNWTWLGKGEQGYLVKPSTGTVRIYPVRGDQTKYIQVSGLADKVCEVNQIDDRNLEIFADKPNTRWSLKMGPQGFKPEIILKPGYAGDGTFQFRFELNGLTLEGAWIMDGATRVLKMHNPFSIDAEGTQRAVTESLVDGVITLTADLDGFVYPGVVDPTLGPVNPTKDTSLRASTANNGWGQYIELLIWDGGTPSRGILQFDASAIPSDNIATSATLELWLLTANIVSLDLLELTVFDWEDAGINAAGAEANWNNYKDPNVAWPGGAGGLGDTDATYKVSATTQGANAWTTFTPTDLCSHQIADHGGLINVMVKFTTESASGVLLSAASLENATAANRPKLTIDYEEAAGQDVLMGGGLLDGNVLSGGSFNNFGGFGF